MAPRSVVVHGHFYQPPRENPWLGYVEAEANAAPHHDWNRRVEQECYRAVAAARIPDASGRIARIVNTLERISFDFGATLLDWMEAEAPATYAAVLDADRRSRQRLGFGNAIAAPYHHVILPLASRRDKVTEVRWGIADFRQRFGRDPEGMWLPETAVDEETLEVLAAHGIRFTILAPHQVGHVPAEGLPGRYKAGGGRELALFIYDGPLSHDVAFGQLLQDAVVWANRLLGAGGGALVSMATDGETFGHHHRFGEMALARLLEILDERSDAAVTNYAAFLAARPPVEAVELVSPSSWSCPHGVERWRSECGCRAAPEKNWQQRWRAPLRAATDWLAGELHRAFEAEGGALLRDPWAARDACAAVRALGSEAVTGFVAAQAARVLTPEETVRARELLEMEWDANALFTSCAWFFDDVGGLEPLQLMRYAAHAIELCGPAAKDLDAGFAQRLAAAVSNDPAIGDGRRVFLERARPAIAPAARVAASCAALRRFAPTVAADRLYDFDASGDGDEVRLLHRRTGRSTVFTVSVRPLDGWRFTASAAPAGQGGAVSLSLADLTEQEREGVTRALVASLARRTLDAEENAELCEGRSSLGEVLARGLPVRLAALARDRSEAARAAVRDLLDLLELAGQPVPFDAQSVFERVRAAWPADEAQSFSALARRLGFS